MFLVFPIVFYYIVANSILQITYFISTHLFGGNQFTVLFKQEVMERHFLHFLISEHKIFSGIQLFICVHIVCCHFTDIIFRNINAFNLSLDYLATQSQWMQMPSIKIMSWADRFLHSFFIQFHLYGNNYSPSHISLIII